MTVVDKCSLCVCVCLCVYEGKVSLCSLACNLPSRPPLPRIYYVNQADLTTQLPKLKVYTTITGIKEYACFVSMYVMSVHLVCLVLLKAERGSLIPWDWSGRWL